MSYMRDKNGRRLDSFRAVSPERPRVPSQVLVRRVMASPPTVTIESANTIGGSTPSVNLLSGLVRLVGGAGFAAPQSGNALSFQRYDCAPDVNGFYGNSYKVMFHTDALSFEMQVYWAPGAAYRIKVDDEYVTLAAQTPGVSGATRWLKVVFATATPRRIVIELNAQGIGLNVPATATVWPAEPRGPLAVFMGDSLTDGSGGNESNFTTWPNVMGDLLGWENIWNNAVGSTGYLITVGGNPNKALNQVNRLAGYNVTPDVFFGGWGHNDTAPNGDIAAEAAIVYARVRELWPTAVVFAGGPFWNGGAGAMSSWATRESVIFPAIEDQVDYTIPQASGSGRPWLTGTGRVGATTGSGNSDLYVHTDNVHRTQAGENYFGHRMALEFIQRLAG